MEHVLRPLLVAGGAVCVALGVLGIFLPLLPTTPFLLAAAACFARSSPRMLHWLQSNRLFGVYIRNYRAGLGIPRREKIITICLLWLTIGATVVFAIDQPVVRIILVAIALAVTVHLLRIKTFRNAADKATEFTTEAQRTQRSNMKG